MKKPQGYRQAAAEECFCLLVLCLPYYQSLLLAGLSGMVSVLFMTCLLMFVVMRSPEFGRTIATCLRALPRSWVPLAFDFSGPWVLVPVQAVADGPSLAPGFQRPPPNFS